MSRTYYHRHQRKLEKGNPWWRKKSYHTLRQRWRQTAFKLGIDLEQVWPDLKREHAD